MSKFCKHILTLKTEKVANFIKKAKMECSNLKHSSENFSMCLHCGFSKCTDGCSENHAKDQKHPLVLELSSLQIHCWVCDINVEEIDENMNHSAKEEDIENSNKILCKIADLASKNLTKANNNKKKAEKKEKITESTKNNQEEKIEKTKPKPVLEESKIVKKSKTNETKNKESYINVIGLTNLGNTCFFNSILQCLYSTELLHEFYNKTEPKDDLNITFKKFLMSSDKNYNPKNLLSLLSKTHKFLKNMDQQDAYELYVLLMDSLIESAMKKDDKKDRNLTVGNIFGFICLARLECLECKKVSWNKDFNLSLTVSLTKQKVCKWKAPEDEEVPKDEIGEDGCFYPKYSVSNNFIDNFFAPSSLGKENYFICEYCKESNAIQKFYLKNAPEVLVVNFKRFNNSGAKINSSICIPDEINLESHCLGKSSSKYELYAGSAHSGSSKGGHYVAYSKRNESWYYFSDSHVKHSSLNSMKDSNPYVIFYRKIKDSTNNDEPSEADETHKSESDKEFDEKVVENKSGGDWE